MTAPARATAAVLRDAPAPGVARLRLNREERRNVMDAELRDALDEQLAAALADDAVAAIVLAGGAKAFSAGGDLASMEGIDEAGARERIAAGHRLVRRLAAAEKPVVGAPAGWAVGAGVGLLLLCDHLVGAPSARFSFPFLKLALVPDWGVGATLAERVGPARARQLILHARTLDAEEALAIGLLDELADDADAVAVGRAAALAEHPREALGLVKRMLDHERLEAVLALEADAQPRCLVSEASVQRRTAFLERRGR